MFNSYQVASKSFQQLSAQELYAILALRLEVFCVEQNCPYQDIDFQDQHAQHIFIAEGEKIIAYARVMTDEQGIHHIGRVVVAQSHRQHKLATKIMQHCIEFVKTLPEDDSDSPRTIVISAQSYLQNFYRSLGFVSTQDYYLEDDIPHERMQLQLS